MKHNLFSQDSDMVVNWFDKYDKEAILKAIVTHLTINPTDTLEHCKEYSKSDVKHNYGNEIINFYEVNKKTGRVCRVVTNSVGKESYREVSFNF